MTEYIPYSKRNGITDPFLASLFDYLERVAGWDIEEKNGTYNGHTSIVSIPHHLYIFEEQVVLSIGGRTEFQMQLKLFEQEYKSLLSHYKA